MAGLSRTGDMKIINRRGYPLYDLANSKVCRKLPLQTRHREYIAQEDDIGRLDYVLLKAYGTTNSWLMNYVLRYNGWISPFNCIQRVGQRIRFPEIQGLSFVD